MVCISEKILSKYLSEEKSNEIICSPTWFNKNTISTKYKENLTNFFRGHIPIIENLINLKLISLLDCHTELIINTLYKYVNYHKNYGDKISIENDEQILKRALKYLQNCNIINLTVSDLSKNTFVHTITLQNVFKQNLGVTPKQFLKIEKLNLIGNDLINSDC